MVDISYYKRYSKAAIEEALLDTPVVFIMGARQSKDDLGQRVNGGELPIY